MSPIVKRKRDKFKLPSKYLLFILTMLCIIMMILSFTTSILSVPFNYLCSFLVVPFEKGLTNVGNYAVEKSEQFKELQEVLDENESLKNQIADLTEENMILQQGRYELTNLQELYELDAEYETYHKVGARIISKDATNWYNTFIIDKGTADGINVNCNVIAGGGLVGRVIEAGPHHAKVSSIISDGVNTGGMVLSTGDNLIVTGNLELMKDGKIEYSQLVDSKNRVEVGDKIVTSNISSQYLPGLLIGYISSISTDANNLTKSGKLTPVVDFEHMREVLVIRELKDETVRAGEAK